MPPARFVRLTPEEDDRLREIEQNQLLKPKVRLRAQVLCLFSAWGESVERIATYTGRSPSSVLRDLDRWEERGFEGSADGAAPGNPPRITVEVRAFMEQRLSEEERNWNATQLQGVLEERFGIEVTPEAVRQHLLALGYRWKRTRYVSSRQPDSEEERKARADLEELKRGTSRRTHLTHPKVPGRERVLPMPLPPAYYTWTIKGREHQHQERTRWGKQQGRINLLGTLCLEEGEAERLEYRLLEGSCRSGEEEEEEVVVVVVVSYLDGLLAEKARREGKPLMVVLDNAPLHKAGWSARGGRGGKRRGSSCTTCCRRTART